MAAEAQSIVGHAPVRARSVAAVGPTFAATAVCRSPALPWGRSAVKSETVVATRSTAARAYRARCVVVVVSPTVAATARSALRRPVRALRLSAVSLETAVGTPSTAVSAPTAPPAEAAVSRTCAAVPAPATGLARTTTRNAVRSETAAAAWWNVASARQVGSAVCSNRTAVGPSELAS